MVWVLAVLFAIAIRATFIRRRKLRAGGSLAPGERRSENRGRL